MAVRVEKDNESCEECDGERHDAVSPCGCYFSAYVGSDSSSGVRHTTN
jgi:hypothetical protein